MESFQVLHGMSVRASAMKILLPSVPFVIALRINLPASLFPLYTS